MYFVDVIFYSDFRFYSLVSWIDETSFCQLFAKIDCTNVVRISFRISFVCNFYLGSKQNWLSDDRVFVVVVGRIFHLPLSERNPLTEFVVLSG